ncbi:hypothetical protein Tco_0483873 [Tanacetum coccineum]
MMWACPKKIIESVPCLIKSFIKSLLKSRDFILKICCFGRREEFVDEFRNKIIPCENRSRGFFSKPNPGGTLEGKWEKHKLYRCTRDVRELHRRSDLVEITNVGMRVFFVMSKKLFVLNEGKQSVLKLKVVRGDLGHNDGILVTLGELRIAKVAIGGIRCGVCRQSGEERGTVLGSIDQENYVEGWSMRIPRLLEANGFCFWKARFDTYIKSKDIDLWQVIQHGNFVFEMEDLETKMMKDKPYELLEEDDKNQLGKNNKSKMTL